MLRGIRLRRSRASVLQQWQTRSHRRGLLTLAIETSCDDTAVAVVEKLGSRGILHFNKKITADNSQYGGIHPLQAQESHERNLAVLLVEAWRQLGELNPSTRLHLSHSGSGNVPQSEGRTRHRQRNVCRFANSHHWGSSYAGPCLDAEASVCFGISR